MAVGLSQVPRSARVQALRYVIPGRVDVDDLVQDAYVMLLLRPARTVEQLRASVRNSFRKTRRFHLTAARSPIVEQALESVAERLVTLATDPAGLTETSESYRAIEGKLDPLERRVLYALVLAGGCYHGLVANCSRAMRVSGAKVRAALDRIRRVATSVMAEAASTCLVERRAAM